MLRPVRSYLPLWHAHQMVPISFRYCTVQSRCVHVAENARISPSWVRTRMTGLFPKRTMLPLFLGMSASLPALTLLTSTSPCFGGLR